MLRGHKVMIDRDLAKLYDIETRVLNQAVRRHRERFPDDFVFVLTRDEIRDLSQIVINPGLKNAPNVFAFTEYGVSMFALPRGGVPSSDLLVTTPNGGKTISLQIKTATKQENRWGGCDYLTWEVSAKSRTLNCESHRYVFVDLRDWPNGQHHPEVYFVPSCDVAESLKPEWNKTDATRLYFPLFIDINAKAKMYAPGGKIAAHYKGLEGFRRLKEQLVNAK